MKKLLLILTLLIASSAAHAQAGPKVLRWDVDPATAQCGVTIDALPKVTINAKTVPVSPDAPTGRVCDYDTAAIGHGNHTSRATAIFASTPTQIGGETATSMPPFDFVKIDLTRTGVIPANGRIVGSP